MIPFAHYHTNSLSFNCSVSEECHNSYQLHCHSFYELYYFIDGDVDYLVEGKQYKPQPQSLLLLSPNVFHGVKVNSSKPYCRLTLHFYPNVLTLDRRQLLLSSFCSPKIHSKKEIYFENVSDYHITYFFQALSECCSIPEELKKELFPTLMEGLLSQILIMSNSNQPFFEDIKHEDTIAKVVEYLNQNIANPISLDQVAEHFYINKYYLNKLFRKNTGTTVGNYLLFKRITYAQQMLMNGSSANQAALASGFSDYSSFYRAYSKLLGHSPIKDRSLL